MTKLAQRDLVIVDAVAREAGDLVARLASEITRDIDRRVKALEERVASLLLMKEGPPGKDGQPGKDGPPGPGWAPRGLWLPDQSYAALDVVQHDGGAWLALRDDPGPIGQDGWQMIVSRGRSGGRGEKGETGPAGALQPGMRIALEMDDEVVEAVVL